MDGAPGDSQSVEARLGLWDTVSIIVGIVIGATIYKMPPFILSNVSGPWQALGVWALGGALSFIGALCYAELASTYPGSGGDYVFLGRAFGPWLGFVFGWAQLAVILPSSIGTMAFVFADYALQAGFPVLAESRTGTTAALAAAAVAGITLLNTFGIVFGKRTQNLLTVAKVVGLGAIISAGLFWAQPGEWVTQKPVEGMPGFGLALVIVMYAYGGWNDAAFVAAEIRNRQRNIPLALLLGVGAITVIYLLVMSSYILVLGFEGVRASKAVAADVLGKELGDSGTKAMCALVMISALGALNGLVLTGARVYNRLGQDHSAFAFLGRWNARSGAPITAFVVQALITLALILLIGTESGQGAVDQLLASVRHEPVPWSKFGGGFETLLSASAPVFWLFFLLSGVSLFALRERDPHLARPFSVPLYPLLPVIFCGLCLYMWYSASDYAGKLSVVFGWAPLALALPLYLVSRHRPVADAPAPAAKA